MKNGLSQCILAQNTPAYYRKRGFNLIEIAIVLGVTGVVIGGVWVATSSVRENMAAAEIAKEIIRVRRQM